MDKRHAIQFFSLILLFALICSAAHAMTLDIIVVERTEGKVTPLDNAMVYADGGYQGRTDKDGMLSITVSGFQPVPLRVVKPGYDDGIVTPDLNETAVLVPMARKNVSLEMQLFDADLLTPISNATVTASAPNISVSRLTNAEGAARLKLLGETTYSLEARAPGYQSRSSPFDVGLEPLIVQWVMVKENRVSFSVRAGDSQLPVGDAVLTVDGMPRGKTDDNGVLSVELPRGRSYDIRFKAPGYLEYQEKRQVLQNDAIIPVTLAPSLEELTVSVFSGERQPISAASVLINGNQAGTTSRYGMARIPSIRPGEYLIEVRAAGYHDLVKKMTIQEKNEDLVFELVPLTGTVKLAVVDREGSGVPGAPVLVDGRAVGVTNDTGFISLPVQSFRTYEVEVIAKGYIPNRTGIIVNESVVLATPPITLQKEFDWTIPVIIAVIGVVAVLGAVLLVVRLKNRRAGGRRPGGPPGKGL